MQMKRLSEYFFARLAYGYADIRDPEARGPHLNPDFRHPNYSLALISCQKISTNSQLQPGMCNFADVALLDVAIHIVAIRLIGGTQIVFERDQIQPYHSWSAGA